MISIAPEARASIAAHFSLDAAGCHGRLISLFQSLGADYVFDTSFARLIQMCESRAEVLSEGRPKPLLSSDCPGWICYAEKTHAAALPFISTVKSPQQISGVLVKQLLARRRGLEPRQVYHVAVMMCFDKKLEATRADFAPDGVRHVDTVITSAEVLDILERKGISFVSLPVAPYVEQPFFDSPSGHVFRAHSSGSGSQAEDMLVHVARHRFGKESFKRSEIEWKVGRNPDLREAALSIDGREVFRVCVANGFRNIQNIVRRVKGKGCEYDFVEVMACPSGCLNGGGQIRASHDRDAAREKLAQVQATFSGAEGFVEEPEESVTVRFLYDQVVGGQPGSEAARALFHTQYHAVPPMDNGLLIKW